MAENLTQRSCAPCRGGIPPLAREEATAYLAQVPGWELAEDSTEIHRTFKVGDFAGALAFVQRVGLLAEAEWHHPNITFGWGYATISLRTKKIKGLHENDFIMAAKIDKLASTAA